ncbi:uncharacterized protein EURHEDRAFT_264010 [Aspergillus ruber CBS 135680]|uniref:Uncharacterized protein n=1 Tax=Aspergillus ruber (strain CBS 135680) TaxID=1388766 RepID=A0A017SMC9_ASPRC|nr:uncharacterized protein EURHEDRAFT_264010 [Aspergillus ruber CBS 135680]EYE97941.1 hypothetical protein EURHEDRAFT_264010 [Aspergillus ruber CBS 135680]
MSILPPYILLAMNECASALDWYGIPYDVLVLYRGGEILRRRAAYVICMQANLNDDDRIVANKNNRQTERAKEILSVISWAVWRCSLLCISGFHP